MLKINLKTINEINNKSKLDNRKYKGNNIYNFKVNMPMLYHYTIPKYGYCYYNFDNVKSDLSNGYIVVNLNDILSYKALSLSLNRNNSDADNIELKGELANILNIALFNTLDKYRNNNYQIIYYLSIHNMLKKYGNTDNEIKANLTNKCNKLYEILNKAIPNLNILISYQYDRFYIRNEYFNDFINSYIKTNVKYLSVNYEVNKFLVGKYYELDMKNVYRYVNNNFLSCYKNNLNFISIKSLLNNNTIINSCNSSDNITNNTSTNNTINNSNNPFTFKMNSDNGFIKASSVNILDINEVSNISGNTTPNKSCANSRNNSFTNLNSLMKQTNNQAYTNNQVCINNQVYIEDKIKLMTDVSEYKSILNTRLNENMKQITDFFVNTLTDCTNTVIIGANLDYIYDSIIIENLKSLILSLNNSGSGNSMNKSAIIKGSDDIGNSVSKLILDVIKTYSSNNVKKINLINVKGDEVSLTLLEAIKNNIVKDAYNILVNTELTRDKFEKIYKYLATKINSCSNIYYDFEINKRLRLALGINKYYENFTIVNSISSVGKYNNNRVRYAKFKDFMKYVNNYTINNSNTKSDNSSNPNNNSNNEEAKCCKCCKCRDMYDINYYPVQYLPYLENIKMLNDIELDLFL
jgi:hypothetical protein